MTHTPGPWAYQERSDAYTHIVRAPGGRFICQLSQDTSGESEANARLIAAAPDMLAALVSADAAFAQVHKFNRLPAGENNAGWRDVRAAMLRARTGEG